MLMMVMMTTVIVTTIMLVTIAVDNLGSGYDDDHDSCNENIIRVMMVRS